LFPLLYCWCRGLALLEVTTVGLKAILTIPDRSSDSNPEPEPSGPDDNTVDVLRERIDCMLDDNKNGTLVLDVFGIDPPCETRVEKFFRAPFSPSTRHSVSSKYSQSYFGRAARSERKKEEIIWVNEPFFHHFNAEIIFITLNYARATGDTPTVECFWFNTRKFLS
jgi:hypothetical protein